MYLDTNVVRSSSIDPVIDGVSMKYEIPNDQNRERNTEKPQNSVFHLIYSLLWHDHRTRRRALSATAASSRHYFFGGAATRDLRGEGTLAFAPLPRSHKPAVNANATPTRSAVKGFSWICLDTDRLA
jgi:hypothetical protein